MLFGVVVVRGRTSAGESMRPDIVFLAGLAVLGFGVVNARSAPVVTPSLVWPVCAGLAGPYGWRIDDFTGRLAFHNGVDLIGTFSDIVHAADVGRVISTTLMGPYGLTVETDTGNGVRFRYGHLSSVLVMPGDTIKQGQAIGHVGGSGRVKVPQLHFEVWIGDRAQNPLQYLDKEAGVY